MSTEVKVPTLGESVAEATIGEWLKKPGEAVALDEPIASLETDKVAVEVPSPVAGVMGQYLAQVGDNVAVGAVIATIETGSGAAAANLDLSLSRAAGVLAALKAAAPSLPDDRLPRVEAFGEALPMACDETAAGRRLNRRVELWLRTDFTAGPVTGN